MNTNYYFLSWEICTDNIILKKVEQLYSIYTVIKYNVGNLNFELFSSTNLCKLSLSSI